MAVGRICDLCAAVIGIVLAFVLITFTHSSFHIKAWGDSYNTSLGR